MPVIPELPPHRADFIIWMSDGGVPYGSAATDRGREVYGLEITNMLTVDPHEFFNTVPNDIVIGVVTEDRGLQYASKDRLQ